MCQLSLLSNFLIFSGHSSLIFALGVMNLGITGVQTDFNPSMDSDMFSIVWKGPLDLDKQQQQQEEFIDDHQLRVTTNKRESYHCILPDYKKESKDSANSYTGPTPAELLAPLFKQSQCSYRLESYWTYELCHGKHLKQYHETKESGSRPQVQEYYLGYGNHRDRGKGTKMASEESEEEESASTPTPVHEVDGVNMPYFEVIMDDGTKCDLTHQPRKAHVMYVCQSEGRGEVYELKESLTCEYDVIVLTSLLCKHPDFKPKSTPVSEIHCYSIVGSPIKPSELSIVENERTALQSFPPQTTQPTEIPKTPDQKHTPYKQPEITPPPPKLGAVTDKQTLRDFFSGSHCLTGGGGWWKHELCYGKFARQFHQEKGKDITVSLGTWDKPDHLAWLNAHPLKRPKHKDVRKHVSHYYANGDKCDITQKPRHCEVKLKCLEATKIPHAVILSLAEPKPCEYVLTVESNLFCPVLKQADDDGLFENLEI